MLAGKFVLIVLLVVVALVPSYASALDQGVITFTEHATSGRPALLPSNKAPGLDMGTCPGAGQSYTVTFDMYLLNLATGPNRIILDAQTAPSLTELDSRPKSVPIRGISYRYEQGTSQGTEFTDSRPLFTGRFIVGGRPSDPNVPASGQQMVRLLDAAANPHTHVSVTFVLGPNRFYRIHGGNLDATADRENNFYIFFSSSCENLDVWKFFSDTQGNPIRADADGKAEVDVVAPNNIVRSTNPGHVVTIIDITNPTALTFSTGVQVTDELAQDWTVFPSWSGRSTGNVKVCFYDTTAFPLTGFPYSPNWAFECVGGIDITSQASFSGTTDTTVSVTLDASLISQLGGFGPGDHIVLSIKMSFGLKGTSLALGYFCWPNSKGVYFKPFTDMAAIAGDGIYGVGFATFRAYLKENACTTACP